jgi:hypothetical protein
MFELWPGMAAHPRVAPPALRLALAWLAGFASLDAKPPPQAIEQHGGNVAAKLDNFGTRPLPECSADCGQWADDHEANLADQDYGRKVANRYQDGGGCQASQFAHGTST